MKRLTNRQDASTKCWAKESRTVERQLGLSLRICKPGEAKKPLGPMAQAWTCPAMGAGVGHGAEHRRYPKVEEVCSPTASFRYKFSGS